MASWRQRVRALEEQLKIKDEIIQTKDNIIQNQGGVISKLEEKIKLLEQHVLHLENKLRKYINENTPSSKKPDWDKKSPDRINKEKKPIGKPKGSNGGTRLTPEIDDEELVTLQEYEGYLDKPINFLERIVGDIPPPSKVKWIRYILAQYTDPTTGETIIATHPNCPKEGSFGPNLRALIAILREKAKLSEEQTIELLNSLYSMNIAPGTLEAELSRTGKILKPHYDAVGEAINNAPIKHSDETGQSVNGDNWHMFCFSTQKHTYFFCEENKKASHVKNRLNDDWNKVLNCDGNSIYSWWYAKQRCWGHAIRKEAWLLDENQTKERKLLHEAISGTYKLCEETLGKGPPGPHQLWDVMFLRNRLWQAIKYKWKDEKCQKIANYMKNGWDSWFTFMFVEGVEPTNNLNERDIRKHVMKRKVSGAFRSEEGLKNHCMILSVLETWRKMGKNVYDELIEQIKFHNSAISWAS